MHSIPVRDIPSYAAVLLYQQKLRLATGQYGMPVLADRRAHLDEAARVVSGLSLPTSFQGPALLERQCLKTLWSAVRATAEANGGGELSARPGALHSSEASESAVVVIEGDLASVIGVALAAFSGRSLRVIDRDSLSHPGEWATTQRFTLVASPALVSLSLLGRLSDLAIPTSRGPSGPPFTVMTASSLDTVSRVAYRSLVTRPGRKPRPSAAVLEIPPHVPFSRPTIPGCRILINPSQKEIRRAFLESPKHYGSVSFAGHGREYCGRLGKSALCAQGEEGHAARACLDGMTCFDPRWLRLSPKDVSAGLVFVNSCSVIKPSRTPYDYTRTLGMQFLEGATCGVISSYQVVHGAIFDNYLFHALAISGYSLAEIVYLLNSASPTRRRLVGIGDAEFRLTAPANDSEPAQVRVQAATGGSWAISPATADETLGHLVKLTFPDLHEAAVRQELLSFDTTHEAGSRHGEAVSGTVGAIFPGLRFPETMLFRVGRSEFRSAMIVRTDHRLIQDLTTALESGARKHARLRCYYPLGEGEEYPLRRLEGMHWRLIQTLHRMATQHRRHMVPLNQLEGLRDAVARLESTTNQRLVRLLGRYHCGDMVLTELLRETASVSGDPCPYCQHAITESTNVTEVWPGFTVVTGICPVCGIIFYRTDEELEVVLLCDPTYRRAAARTFEITALVTNHGQLDITGCLGLTFFPKVAKVPRMRASRPAAFRVGPKSVQRLSFEARIPDGLPSNVYVVQATVAHDRGVDAAARYVRIL